MGERNKLMETQRICPGCRKPLAPDAPLGLCPECLIKCGASPATDPGDPSLSASGFVPPPVAEIANLFPQLEIIEFIGKGGMGAVYKARQPTLDRFVALKILPPNAGGPGFAERFNREARALARLSHPNIVMVHDFGQAGGLHYLLMEYVDGGNLRQVEAAGRLTPEQALAIVPQICDALQFAHNEGIVHRDIKPENLLLDKKGRVKITDFGIAKILGLSVEKTPLTGARDVVGTPHYMAPEQLEKPQTVDHRADIYSLGVVFYEMLTGELPLGRFAPPSSKVQVDVRLDEVVLQALEKEPRLRYQQASQVKTAVETISTTPFASASADAASGGQSAHVPVDAEALTAQILARDYVLNIGSCMRRGWVLVKRDFWPIIGVTALVQALLWTVQSAQPVFAVHRANFSASAPILALLLGGPLMGGLYLFHLKKIRGEAARVETAFAGFSGSFLQLFLANFVSNFLLVLGLICFVVPFVYLLIAWIFTLPLVIDKRLEFWPAMRLSRKAVSKHWWKMLGFLLVLVLFNVAGVLMFCVGIFLTLPISIAALMYAYEDIFGAVPVGTSGPLGSQAAGAAAVNAGLPDQPGRRTVILLVLLAAFFAVSVGEAFSAVANARHFLVALAAALAFASGIMLLIWKSPWRGRPLAVFLPVFMAVFGATAFVTGILPNSFVGITRVNTRTNPASPTYHAEDSVRLQTEFEVMKSEVVLNAVIEALDLNQKWGRRYARGRTLKSSETLALLQARTEIHPLRNTSIVEIKVFDEKAVEAANVANQIAEAYKDYASSAGDAGSASAHPQVEIIDSAVPAVRPIRPNRVLNVVLGALAGMFLGAAAAGVWAAFGEPKGEA